MKADGHLRTPSGAGRLVRVAAFGFATGLRSVYPSAVLANAMASGRLRNWSSEADDSRLVRLFASPWAHRVLAAGVLIEFVGDKLPMTPSRLVPRGLIGRIVIGATAGAVVGRLLNLPMWQSGAVAEVSTLVGAWSGFHLRAALVQNTRLPDPFWAVLEDVAAISIARRAIR